jgi:micrococcal nuclease
MKDTVSSSWGTLILPKFVLFTSAILSILLIPASCGSKTRDKADRKTIFGKVVGITDGDTFTILTEDKNEERIRLYGIDCPEKKQAFGAVAKRKLSELIFGKQVRVDFKAYDKWRRVVGVVFYGEENVNESMLEAGLAWHFLRYDDNQKWTSMEEDARKKKVGLWVDINPTPPWEWRHK